MAQRCQVLAKRLHLAASEASKRLCAQRLLSGCRQRSDVRAAAVYAPAKKMIQRRDRPAHAGVTMPRVIITCKEQQLLKLLTEITTA
jgi:hypothetical protein